MTAGEVLQALQARDIWLSIDGDRVVYDAPAGRATGVDER
jgi:hypothetical protein